MTKPYSLDLRGRVTERVAAGDSVRAVATIFTVSVASVVRWSQRLRRTGRPSNERHGNRDRAHHRHRSRAMQDRNDEPRLQHAPLRLLSVRYSIKLCLMEPLAHFARKDGDSDRVNRRVMCVGSVSESSNLKTGDDFRQPP